MVIRRTRSLAVTLVTLLAATLATFFAGSGIAHADSAMVYVHSNAMNKTIPVKVLRAAGGARLRRCTCSTVCAPRTTTTAG